MRLARIRVDDQDPLPGFGKSDAEIARAHRLAFAGKRAGDHQNLRSPSLVAGEHDRCERRAEGIGGEGRFIPSLQLRDVPAHQASVRRSGGLGNGAQFGSAEKRAGLARRLDGGGAAFHHENPDEADKHAGEQPDRESPLEFRPVRRVGRLRIVDNADGVGMEGRLDAVFPKPLQGGLIDLAVGVHVALQQVVLGEVDRLAATAVTCALYWSSNMLRRRSAVSYSFWIRLSTFSRSR